MSRYRIMAATVVAGTLLALANGASADPIALTLSGPIDGNTVGPQSTSNPCIIAGTTCQQPDGFGYNNFTSDGNTGDYDMYSTDPTATVADGVEGTPYTVAQIDAITDSNPFVVAIDVNTTGANSETLELFEVIVNNVVVYSYSGPTEIGDVNNNGNGWADWTLGIIDLSSFNPDDTVLFHAVWSGAVDGAESFFIVGSEPTVVPEPATLLLFGSAMTGLGIWGRKRTRRSSQS